MAVPNIPIPEVKVDIKSPDAGKIKVIVSGQLKVTSTDPRVVVERRR